MIIFDLECDGLNLDEITKIHCICLRRIFDDGSEGPVVCYSSDYIAAAVEQLESKWVADNVIVGHSVIAFDIPVIQKFFPWFKPKKVIDTLVLARMFEPDRPKHSLESYAKQFGMEKVQNEEWDVATEVILERCKSDVEITTKLYEYLSKSTREWNWEPAILLESSVARIIAQQARTGWKFDTEKANQLITRLNSRIAEIDKEVEPLLKKKVVHVTTVNKPFKKNGEFTQQVLRVTNTWPSSMFSTYPFPIVLVEGAFSVIEYENINLNSNDQMKELLLSLGWKPTEWNHKKDSNGKPIKDLQGKMIKTSPKLTEDSFDSLPPGLGQILAERVKSCHRLHQIEGFLKNVRKDGRIEAQANPCGTNTARMTHKIVVNIPKAIDSVFIGREMRELFTVDKKRILVGGDASSLEWRITSHYINRPVVTEMVVNGDIHMFISDIAQLNDRNLGKRAGFLFLYGGSAPAMSAAIGCSVNVAKKVMNNILSKFPGLREFLDNVKNAARRGWLKALDGRKIFIRSIHSSPNALIQCGGSLVNKTAMVILDKEISDRKWDAKQVGNYHDEFIFDCEINIGNPLTELLKNAIVRAGEVLKLRCPMDAQARIGNNWAEIH